MDAAGHDTVLDTLTTQFHDATIETVANSYTKSELSGMYETLYERPVPSICRTRYSIARELKAYVDMQRQKKAFEGLRVV